MTNAAEVAAKFEQAMQDFINEKLAAGFQPPLHLGLMSGGGTCLLYRYTKTKTGDCEGLCVNGYGPPLTLPVHMMLVDSQGKGTCKIMTVISKGDVH